MQPVAHYQEEFVSHLLRKVERKEPRNLYDPMVYILSLGGKRVRPVLVLLASEVFGSHYKKALDAALAVEVFHNFSLIHDDIMDAAPLRRGKSTVHEQWDVNTAILSGDAMLIKSYQFFETYEEGVFKELVELFSKTAIEVCEGQQYDMDFETRDDVGIEEYLKMIEYKTAVLIGASLKMGAVVAKASEENKQKIYEFGRLLGIAFQLQDDYLDAFGDPETFGKQVGGDIIENKKTFLYLTAAQQGSAKVANQLQDLYSIDPPDAVSKIEMVKSLFETSGAADLTKKEIEKYTEMAFRVLDELEISNDKKEILRTFGQNLMNRKV